MSAVPGVVRHQLRPGVYCDSIVLLQVQKGLATEPGVLDAAAVMATPANLALLAASGLRPAELGEVAADDLLISVRAESSGAAESALAAVDGLLARRGGAEADEDYRPKSLATALQALPEARWVLVSVPGRFAAREARRALAAGRHVFLFSDNVPLAEELALKEQAARQGLLVMGPDCGTARVAGVGLGFANRVRRGGIGLVAASGTGLQAVASRLDALGAGVSQALGIGGRDLSTEVGGIAARQALDLLARDPATRVIALVGKPPAPAVAARLLASARATGKPTVVCLLGFVPPARRWGCLHFALSLSEAADLAAGLLASSPSAEAASLGGGRTSPPGWLRGLFAGGTLAYEALLALGPALGPIHANLASTWSAPLADPHQSAGHTLLDLGDDAFTVGRLHPMLDQDLRLRRFRREAADPTVGLVLLDVVLGEGAHADPASEWAPAIAAARAGRELDVVVLLVGTGADPQGLESQRERLEAAGAKVFLDSAAAFAEVGERLAVPAAAALPPVPLAAVAEPFAAVNVGLESFAASVLAQGGRAVQVEWRPPAGGDERLLALLDRLGR